MSVPVCSTYVTDVTDATDVDSRVLVNDQRKHPSSSSPFKNVSRPVKSSNEKMKWENEFW